MHKTLPLTRTQGGKAYFRRCRQDSAHARTHTGATHTSLPQKCTPPTQRCPPPQSRLLEPDSGTQDFSTSESVFPFSCSYFPPVFLTPLMSDQGHLILSNPLKMRTESDTACAGCCKVVGVFFFSLRNSCEQEGATMGPSWYSE